MIWSRSCLSPVGPLQRSGKRSRQGFPPALGALALAASLVVAAACHSPTEDTPADSSPTSEGVTDSGGEATPPRPSRLCSDPEDFDRQLDFPAEGEALTLRGAETHAFTLTTREDETLEILANQDGIDVYLALFDEAGERLVATDRPTDRLGEERLIWVGGAERELRLHMCAWGSQGISGDYTLRLRRRPVEPGDHATVTAYRHVEEAKRLRRLGPPPAGTTRSPPYASPSLRRSTPVVTS